jgi:hypothetical protein
LILCEFDEEFENEGTSAEFTMARVHGTEVAALRITTMELGTVVVSGDERSGGT